MENSFLRRRGPGEITARTPDSILTRAGAHEPNICEGREGGRGTPRGWAELPTEDQVTSRGSQGMAETRHHGCHGVVYMADL